MEQKKIIFESSEMIGRVFGAYDSNIKIIENNDLLDLFDCFEDIVSDVPILTKEEQKKYQ